MAELPDVSIDVTRTASLRPRRRGLLRTLGLARPLVALIGVILCFALVGNYALLLAAIVAIPFLLPLVGWPFERLWKYTAVALVLAVGLFLVLGTPHSNPGPRRRIVCLNNLSQIAKALLLYHQEHGSLPPAYIADADGKPMHSWRVLILPYLERQDLYESYRFDEPWDGSNNRKLHAHSLNVFCCAKDGEPLRAPKTSYVVLTGPNALFQGARPPSLSPLSEQARQTLLVVEAPDSGIHWMEPRDITPQAYRTIVQAPLTWSRPRNHKGRGNVAYADGHVESLPDRITDADLYARMTIAGGEGVVPP